MIIISSISYSQTLPRLPTPKHQRLPSISYTTRALKLLNTCGTVPHISHLALMQSVRPSNQIFQGLATLHARVLLKYLPGQASYVISPALRKKINSSLKKMHLSSSVLLDLSLLKVFQIETAKIPDHSSWFWRPNHFIQGLRESFSQEQGERPPDYAADLSQTMHPKRAYSCGGDVVWPAQKP